MRHEAYTREGTIERRSSGLFHDPYDETPNAWLIGVFIDGELASSLRLHISASTDAPLPAFDVYPDILTPYLQAGRMVIDATRFVSRLAFSQCYPEMPYLTLRPAFLAEVFFDADFITAACRVEHQAFYRRMFGGVPLAEPREYPNLKRLMAFLAYDCRTRRDGIYTRYPFYRSSEGERLRLFAGSSKRSKEILQAIGRAPKMDLSRV